MPDLDDLVPPPREFDDNDHTVIYEAQRVAGMALKGAVEAMQQVQTGMAETVQGIVEDNYQDHELMRDEIREVDGKAKKAKEEGLRARITMDRARWYLRGLYAAGAVVIAALAVPPIRDFLARLLGG
jgi:hypothetical protein